MKKKYTLTFLAALLISAVTVGAQASQNSISETGENIIFDTSVKGRGESDCGRSEPVYEGKYGYAALTSYEVRALNSSCLETPWQVPVYQKGDGDSYEKSGTIEHKTVVKVISQTLEHEGYGAYSGFLEVAVPGDDETVYIIDVNNFLTNAYWDFSSPSESTKYGSCLAKYTQRSAFNPVYKNNKPADIAEGTVVLITGRTGTYGRDYVDDEVHQIEAHYFNPERNENSEVFFNEEDLELIY